MTSRSSSSSRDGEVIAWAVAHPYRDREAYAGVGEFSVYVAGAARGRRTGARRWKASPKSASGGAMEGRQSRLPGERGSLALCRHSASAKWASTAGTRKLDGEWRDVVIVERLLGA